MAFAGKCDRGRISSPDLSDRDRKLEILHKVCAIPCTMTFFENSWFKHFHRLLPRTSPLVASSLSYPKGFYATVQCDLLKNFFLFFLLRSNVGIFTKRSSQTFFSSSPTTSDMRTPCPYQLRRFLQIFSPTSFSVNFINTLFYSSKLY